MKWKLPYLTGRKSLPKRFPDYNLRVAGLIHGVVYYQFANIGDMPRKRYEHFEMYMRELEMRATGEEVALWFKQIALQCGDLLKLEGAGGNVATLDLRKLLDIQTMAKHGADRVSYISEPESFLRLASALLLTDNEDPRDYDFEYNHGTKIPDWKKKGRPVPAVLYWPMKRVLNMPWSSPEDFHAYMLQAQNRIKSEFENLESSVSEDFWTTKAGKDMRSLRETLEAQSNWGT